MTNIFFEKISLASVISDVQTLRGGSRLQATIAKLMRVVQRLEEGEDLPNITSCHDGVSLSGSKTIQLVGERLWQRSFSTPKQAQESIIVWGTVGSGNYVRVRSRVPGNHGIQLQIAAAAGSSAAADTYGATPSVLWTPKTADIDDSIATLNANSKLLYAVKEGTGGVIATLAATALTGGAGGGVAVKVGALSIENTKLVPFGSVEPGTANDSYINRWEEDAIYLTIDDADLAVGEAVPTGRTALQAAAGHLVVALHWPDAHFRLQQTVHVLA